MNENSKLQNKFSRSKDTNVMILVITAIAVFVALSFALGDKFFSASNFQSMAFQIPEFGLLAFGMAICMITGGIDLSIVSNAGLSSILGGYVLLGISNSGGSSALAIVVAFAVALGVSTLCGLLNGILIAKFSIVPILATLSTMIFYEGVAMAITSGSTVIGFPEEFSEISLFNIAGVPFVFLLFVAAAIIVALVLARTFFGKNVYLYGENKTVSLFSGIRLNSVIIKTYMLSGLLCGVAGIIMMARVNSAKVGYGETYLLQAILVSVLGGISVSGGKGGIVGVFLGIIVLQMLQSGFTLLGMEPYFKNFIWGTVLIGVMIVNFYLEKRQGRVRPPAIESKGAAAEVKRT